MIVVVFLNTNPNLGHHIQDNLSVPDKIMRKHTYVPIIGVFLLVVSVSCKQSLVRSNLR